MVYTSKDGLVIDFNPAAKLEVQVGTHWCETSVDFFRSWGGDRRVNGRPYNGPVYELGSNNQAITTQTLQHA